MRRCPQCDFIHDDDEAKCAMDGAALVYDSGPLPFTETTSAGGHPNALARHSTLIVTGVILCIAVGIYFHNARRRDSLPSSGPAARMSPYDSPQRIEDRSEGATPLSTSAPEPDRRESDTPSLNAVRTKTKSARTADDSEAERDPFQSTPAQSASPLPPRSPLLSPVPVTRVPVVTSTPAPPKQTQSTPVQHSSIAGTADLKRTNANINTNSNQKSDSKLGSFFKKTGRALTKPFKRD